MFKNKKKTHFPQHLFVVSDAVHIKWHFTQRNKEKIPFNYRNNLVNRKCLGYWACSIVLLFFNFKHVESVGIIFFSLDCKYNRSPLPKCVHSFLPDFLFFCCCYYHRINCKIITIERKKTLSVDHIIYIYSKSTCPMARISNRITATQPLV